jgi:hypothetical protein
MYVLFIFQRYNSIFSKTRRHVFLHSHLSIIPQPLRKTILGKGLPGNLPVIILAPLAGCQWHAAAAAAAAGIRDKHLVILLLPAWFFARKPSTYVLLRVLCLSVFFLRAALARCYGLFRNKLRLLVQTMRWLSLIPKDGFAPGWTNVPKSTWSIFYIQTPDLSRSRSQRIKSHLKENRQRQNVDRSVEQRCGVPPFSAFVPLVFSFSLYRSVLVFGLIQSTERTKSWTHVCLKERKKERKKEALCSRL